MNLSFIKKAAPWIGAVVGSAVPGAAPFVAVASKLLSAGLGTKVAPTVESVSQAITNAMATPEQLAKLKEIDNTFAIQMRQMDIQSVEDFEKIAEADRESARARQQIVKDRLPTILASAITLGFFGLLFAMMKYQVPPASEKVMDIMLGALTTAWISVVSYYFGSSAGSAEKTRIMAVQSEESRTQ